MIQCLIKTGSANWTRSRSEWDYNPIRLTQQKRAFSWLVVFRGPPFCLLVCLLVLFWGGYSWVLRLRLLLLAGLFGVRFPNLGFCQWSGRHCACCPVALRAVRGFLRSGLFPFCWLLSGDPGFQSFFSFFSAPISLSLSLSRPFLLQPLAPGAIPLAPVSVVATFVARVVPRHLLVAYLLVSLRFCEVIFRFALSHLPGGVQLFCFPLVPFQSVLLVCPGCWLVFLALSSAFRQVMERHLLCSLWFGWCFC